MTQKRLHEVAKEYNVSSKEIMEVLAKHNISVKSHLTAIDTNSANILKKVFANKTNLAETKETIHKAPVNTKPMHTNYPKPSEPARPETPIVKPMAENNKPQAQPTKPVEQQSQPQKPFEQQRPPQRPPEQQRPPQRPTGYQQRPDQRPYSDQNRPQNNAQGGTRPPYQGQNRPNTGYQQRPPYEQRPNNGYQQRPDQRPYSDQNRPQDNAQGGTRPPYQGQNRPNTGYQQRPPYEQRPNNGYQQRPDQRPYSDQNRPQDNAQGGTRPPYQGQNRPNTGYQQRPPYEQRPNNGYQQRPDQRPYSDQNRPQNNAQGGTRPPYQGQNRPYNNQGGTRPPYQGQNRPYNNTQGGTRPPYQGQNRPYNNQGGTDQRRPQQQTSSLLPPAPSDPIPQKQNTFTNKGKYSDKNKNDWGNKKSHNKEDSNKHKNIRTNKPQQSTVAKEIKRPDKIAVGDFITVKDLASKIKCEPSEIIKKLFLLGVMVTINQDIDFDTATLVSVDFGVEVVELPPEQDPTEVPEVEDDESLRVMRPPVVTVMGHVDHGKTSLLDAIRKANVTAREAGGITQHIGAYQVNINNKKIVFLDTPGHEAFTSMRARGAQVTDIAILVVAADDGVMPQTIEAINHAKSAKVPIIVAINKIDKENANMERIKQQLAEHELIPEDWGGQTIMVPVSAKQKIGIPDLLEMILLVAEMQELKANPIIAATGTIIEAQLDKGRGPVATVLVQKGTLQIGDTIVAGTAYGKVRAMLNDRGEKVKKAPPATPVEVLGLSDVPQAGDILQVTEERIARAVAEKRIAKKRLEDMQHNQKVSLDDLFKQIQDGKVKDLNILVKSDVQGTIEALKQSLSKIKNDEVKVVIVHGGVGAITESDVMLASASNALIIGFNVRPDSNARKTAENEKVDIRLYRVIYDAINDVEAAMTGMLAPKFEEQIIGKVEIRKVMIINKVPIAGCYVLEGKVNNNSLIRIIRDGIVIHETKIDTLKRFKDDAKEVATGYECGLTLENYRDVRESDILEVYKMQEVEVK